jgi:hypothetical protein
MRRPQASSGRDGERFTHPSGAHATLPSPSSENATDRRFVEQLITIPTSHPTPDSDRWEVVLLTSVKVPTEHRIRIEEVPVYDVLDG